jgi:hypothetical protein
MSNINEYLFNQYIFINLFNNVKPKNLLQYKAWKSQILASTPKDEQKNVIKKLKEEQMRKLALLGEQYEQSIAEMLQKQSVCFAFAFTKINLFIHKNHFSDSFRRSSRTRRATT